MRNRVVFALAIMVAGLVASAGRADSVYVYDDANNAVESFDAQGRVAAMTYDSHDNLVVVATAGPLQTTLSYYDHNANLVHTTTQSGLVTAMSYDSDSNRVITSTGGGHTSEYDSYNHVTYTYDTAHGLVTAMTYDGGSRPIAQAEVDSPTHTTIYRYDDLGNQVSTLDQSGRVTSTTYDGAGGLAVSSDNPLGNTTIYRYDSGDNSLSSITPSGHVTTMAYDSLGRLTAAEDIPAGNSTIYRYDSVGSVVSHFDASGRVTYSAYDSNDRLLFVSVVPLPQSFSMGMTLLAGTMGVGFISRRSQRNGRALNLHS